MIQTKDYRSNMKTEISIKHSTYMLTIKDAIDAIESLTKAKVTKIVEEDGVLTFTLEYSEPEPVDKSGYGMCPNCGRVTELNEQGYCFNIRCPE